MSMVTPALPVVYSIHSSEKKKPTHAVEYVVYNIICNACVIIKSHRFSILLG